MSVALRFSAGIRILKMGTRRVATADSRESFVVRGFVEGRVNATGVCFAPVGAPVGFDRFM